jgi:hypothetical protein
MRRTSNRRSRSSDDENHRLRCFSVVDFDVINRHDSIDPESEAFLAALRSPVTIVPARSETDPSPDVLERIMASRLYPGPYDIFVTLPRDATRQSIGRARRPGRSDHGHIAVRVEPGGDRYRVVVLDEVSGAVPSTRGPYTSFQAGLTISHQPPAITHSRVVQGHGHCISRAWRRSCARCTSSAGQSSADFSYTTASST